MYALVKAPFGAVFFRKEYMESLKINATKMNMSQIFLDSGKIIPVTVVKASETVSSDLQDKEIVVSGVSKGKGFAGVMKRWHFHGQQATRGQSDRPRAAGSIGMQSHRRVLPGKKMAGRMGGDSVTIKGLKIVKVIAEQNELLVSGPVPGARNSKLVITIL